MPETALITDSSSCLPQELRQQYGIRVVQLTLNVGGRSFNDGEITTRELFRLADASKAAPKTASPSPADFLTAYRQAADDGASNVLCLTLSAGYSSTYEAALAGKALAFEAMPGFEVRVVDTGGLAMTHGFAVLAAARALEGGVTGAAAGQEAVRVAERSRLAGVLGTTRYLARGGRVPWVVHWAAQVLHIRPMLAFDGGRARSIGRVRTEERGLEQLIDYAHKYGRSGMRIAVTHAEAPEAADRLADLASRALSPSELLRTDFTSVMAVHTGPGFVGLAFYSDAED